MSLEQHPLRGPFFMVVATMFYVVNDTFMKLAAESLPPFQVLMMRGVAAFVIGLPVLLLLGYGRSLPQMFLGSVLLRNVAETAGVLCYVVALAQMPIADVIALMQVAPLLLLIGASLVLREPITRFALAMIAVGFVGALMVAQPGTEGVSVYALLALANALFTAIRDIMGRRVPAGVPAMVVALSTVLVVLAGATIAHLVSEEWLPPTTNQVLLMIGSGFFLNFGHFFLFLAYRVGRTATVAPFFYVFSFWAVISGIVVFHEMPNALAVSGIVLIAVSGLAIVVLDARRRRLAPAT